MTSGGGVPRRAGAVMNPDSGARRGKRLANRLPELCSRPEWVFKTLGKPLSLDWLGSFVEELDLLVVVGGDGTVGKVASTLHEAVEDPPPLAIVPAGRGNSAYRHYYGDRAWQEVVRGLAGGMRTGPLDLGRVKTPVTAPARGFVLGCSVGLFPHSLRVADRLSWFPGRIAYVLSSAWASLVRPAVPVAVEDAEEILFEGKALIGAAAGGRYRGRDHELFPGSRPGRERLDFLVVEPRSIGGLMELFPAMRRGEHLSLDGVHRWRARRFRLRSSSPLLAEMDGTLFERPVREATLTAQPAALQVAYPRTVHSVESDAER